MQNHSLSVGVVVITLLSLSAISQASAQVEGRWRILANNFPGDLVIVSAPDGTLSGSLYGNPITGYYAPAARQAVFLRGPASAPDQVYIATLAANANSMTGLFYALNTANGGATTARNNFSFRAVRGTTTTPPWAGPNPSAPPTSPPTINGSYRIDGNGFLGDLVINQRSDGQITGNRIYDHGLIGHYAAGTGSIAMVRMAGNRPFQVFVGRAASMGPAPPLLTGVFFPLDASGGASPQRLQFDWKTGDAPRTPNTIVVPAAQDADIVRHTRSLSCNAMIVRVYYGVTGSYVDASRGQARGIRIAQPNRLQDNHQIRWQCRDPGNIRDIATTTCPASASANSNVVRVTRTHAGATTVRCIYRP